MKSKCSDGSSSSALKPQRAQFLAPRWATSSNLAKGVPALPSNQQPVCLLL